GLQSWDGLATNDLVPEGTTESLLYRTNSIASQAGFHSLGNRWIVQVQPTERGAHTSSLNPTGGNRWIVQVQPTERRAHSSSPNPTGGNRWIVQVQPIQRRAHSSSPNPTGGNR